MSNTPKHYFDEKFRNPAAAGRLLPFFHSCDAFFFRSILENKKISPTKCTVFENEDLLYLFYGRPAYKTSNFASSRLNSLLPVSFILRSDLAIDIKRIAPFDTGAYKKGRYKEFMHTGMTLDHFLLTPDKKSIMKTVSYFFDSNENYFTGNAKNEIPHDPLDFEIESYCSLIKGVAQSSADDRKASIEVQSVQHILLSRKSLEGVIIPQHFLSSRLVEDFLKKELQAEVITYESFGIPSPLYYSQVLDLTKQYLIRNKNFNGKN